jgi:hypothetical protein
MTSAKKAQGLVKLCGVARRDVNGASLTNGLPGLPDAGDARGNAHRVRENAAAAQK